MPENILILSYFVENIPYVTVKNRFEVACLDEDIWQMTLHYGFMDFIDVPKALKYASQHKILPFSINVESATYFVEILNILPSEKKKTLLFSWQEKLFAFLMRNYSANLNIEFYQLPYNRTVAIGTYCII